MIVIATLSDQRRLATVLNFRDGQSRTIPVLDCFIDKRSEVPCRPFGITWNKQNLYIANNHQLLRFSKELTYAGTMDATLQANTHQLGFNQGWIWAVSPRTNSLIAIHEDRRLPDGEFDLVSDRFVPRAPPGAPEASDRHHFNSLLWANGSLFVAAHNFSKPSFIRRYNSQSFELEDIYECAGFAIHGLALSGDDLFWISTMTNEIRSNRGVVLRLTRPGYARGFAMTSKYFVVAISEYLIRSQRHGGDSWIQLIERETNCIVDERHLEDTGSINDLRVLNEFDLAHWADPFYAE